MTKPSAVDIPLRLLGVVASGSVAGLVCLILYAGDPTALSWWAFAAPFALWIIGPAITPWVIAWRRRQFVITAIMLVFIAASSLISGLVYYDAFFRSTSSTSALVMIFIPLYQWIALAVVSVIAFASAAWIERR